MDAELFKNNFLVLLIESCENISLVSQYNNNDNMRC